MEFIILILALILVILVPFLMTHRTYSDMLNGTIVGTYKGNKTSGGYIVVEMIHPVENGYGVITKKKVQTTYEVPSEYYDKVKIGDTGVFPY